MSSCVNARVIPPVAWDGVPLSSRPGMGVRPIQTWEGVAPSRPGNGVPPSWPGMVYPRPSQVWTDWKYYLPSSKGGWGKVISMSSVSIDWFNIWVWVMVLWANMQFFDANVPFFADYFLWDHSQSHFCHVTITSNMVRRRRISRKAKE